MLHSINEYTIIPAKTTDIESRSECSPFTLEGSLPLFAAPMSSVIDANNYKEFEEVGINTILPRNIDINIRLNHCTSNFSAFSMQEVKQYFVVTPDAASRAIKSRITYKICIDIANGHMQSLIDLCKLLKTIWGSNIIIMTGNIANPQTYDEYAKAGIDYVRVGIGSGNACTTSANVGIHYPMGSLLAELKIRKDALAFTNISHRPKIIADGGFNNFDQIIKALAIGADYVMLGSILASTEEACGPVYVLEKEPNLYTEEEKKWLIWNEETQSYVLKLRYYYGMSTKQAQIEMGGKGNKTAEGICKEVYIKYSVAKWADNFKNYLKSAMSYSNCRLLSDFKTKADWRLMSNTSYQSYFK